jgi:hypothetical protein
MTQQIVRRSSAAGPCLTEGLFVRETAKFVVYREWLGRDNYAEKETKVAKDRVHLEPCSCCHRAYMD